MDVAIPNSDDRPIPLMPFAGQGMARLALAPLRHLWAAQWLYALIGAGAIGFCAWTAFFPVVSSSVTGLPEVVSIDGGLLEWPVGRPDQLLAQNSFLSVAIQSGEFEVPGQTADIQVVFQKRGIRFSTLLGRTIVLYPETIAAQSGKVLATAWWGAWSWVVLLGLMAVSALGIVASWWLLATVYAPFTSLWLLTLRRPAHLGLAWKLAASALLPASLVVAASVLGYGILMIRVPGLLIGYALHLFAGVMAIAVAAGGVPARPKRSVANPFEAARMQPGPADEEPAPEEAGISGRRTKSDNPFGA